MLINLSLAAKSAVESYRVQDGLVGGFRNAARFEESEDRWTSIPRFGEVAPVKLQKYSDNPAFIRRALSGHVDDTGRELGRSPTPANLLRVVRAAASIANFESNN